MTEEYYELDLKRIIKFFIKEAMKKTDWICVAIDPVENKVIIKRTVKTIKEKG